MSNRFILKLPEAQVNLPHRTEPCALEPAAWEQLSRPEGTEKGELMTEKYKVSLEEPVHTSAQPLSMSQHERNAAGGALCFCFLVYLPPRLHFTSLASRRSCVSLPTERVGTGLGGDTISTSIPCLSDPPLDIPLCLVITAALRSNDTLDCGGGPV